MKNTPKQVQDLKMSVQTLIFEKSRGIEEFSDNDTVVQSICYYLESIFLYGLKNIGYFNKTVIWDYIENLKDCIPNIENHLKIIRNEGKSGIARGRIFFRLALNENTLHSWIKSLVWNKSLTEKYYELYAFLKRPEDISPILQLLEVISTFKFNIKLQDKDIDKSDYWASFLMKPRITPSTLIQPKDEKEPEVNNNSQQNETNDNNPSTPSKDENGENSSKHIRKISSNNLTPGSGTRKKKKKKKIAEIGTAEHDKSEEQREVDLTRVELEKIRSENMEFELALKIAEKETKTLREQLEISNHKIRELEKHVNEFQNYFKITEKDLQNEHIGEIDEFDENDFPNHTTEFDDLVKMFDQSTSMIDSILKGEESLTNFIIHNQFEVGSIDNGDYEKLQKLLNVKEHN
eukprot:TRINITY_DN525_c2_g1_i1.p1 TRINITY_DN525_c2_g1~~TRINITY_DN525_c2_g1_i1.p1  ORF type:complete len:414 (-),score=104.27 TRINITY_DN525_c2_g1_i1:23-1237(-)